MEKSDTPPSSVSTGVRFYERNKGIRVFFKLTVSKEGEQM